MRLGHDSIASMSPLRIGQNIRWETAFTFEDAVNHIAAIVDEHDLFVFEGETPSELFELSSLAERLIASIWTGKPTTSLDAKRLRAMIMACRVELDISGYPFVRTEHLDELSALGLSAVGDENNAENNSSNMKRTLMDGICQLKLRGESRDVRACLWDGRLFRADRTNAVFCRPACRTAYHRAINTAVHSERYGDELMGMFRCCECNQLHLIENASGLTSACTGWTYIAGVRNGNAVCITCARKNHPEWSNYIVPMSTAA